VAEEPAGSESKAFLTFLQEWKDVLGFFAASSAAVLGGLFGPSKYVQVASWGLAAVGVVVGGLIYRWRRRKKALTEGPSLPPANPQAAFRSLAPFEQRDQLPGRARQLEGRSIATRIGNDDFLFGVICGDAGSGKTSLIRSEVSQRLKEAGHEVTYVHSKRRLEAPASSEKPPKERVGAELLVLRTAHLKPTTTVLILDQFEEWFLDYTTAEVRGVLGEGLAQLARRNPPVRVVCVVRREFLVDFQDLAGALPDPLSTRNLFHVRNFTEAQAVDVIKHCAAADQVQIDGEFAEMVAADLAEADQVRPPELQIVCSYLAVGTGLRTAQYRLAGGTAGILAHYIKDAIGSCRSTEQGTKLLRAVCDFPARAKRKPMTASQLAAELAPSGSSSATGEDAATNLANHFIACRILSTEKRADGATLYALIHDYLVDAVKLATSDASTRTEEANQLLRYYVAEGRGVVPWRKLRFIRAFADRRLLQERKARRLLRRSMLAPVASVALVASLAVVLAAGVFLAVTTTPSWRAEAIARHWSADESGQLEVLNRDKSTVVTGRLGSWTTDAERVQIHFWDVPSLRLLATVEKEGTEEIVGWEPKVPFVLIQQSRFERSGEKPRPPRLVSLTSKESLYLPVGYPNPEDFAISQDGKRLSWLEGSRLAESDYETFSLVIYSISDRKVITRLENVPSGVWCPGCPTRRHGRERYVFRGTSHFVADPINRAVVLTSRSVPAEAAKEADEDEEDLLDRLEAAAPAAPAPPPPRPSAKSSWAPARPVEEEKPTTVRRAAFALYDTRTSKQIAVLAGPGAGNASRVTVDERALTVFTATVDSKRLVVESWNAVSGAPIARAEILKESVIAELKSAPRRNDQPLDFREVHLQLSETGTTLAIVWFDDFEQFNVTQLLRARDLERVGRFPAKKLAESTELRVIWADGNDTVVWDGGVDPPRKLLGLRMHARDEIRTTRDMKRAIQWGKKSRAVTLWNADSGRPIAQLQPTSMLLGAEFGVGDNSVGVWQEGGALSVFDAGTGTLVTNGIPSEAGAFYYDSECRAMNVWNVFGQVSRIVEGRQWFRWFVPTKKCAHFERKAIAPSGASSPRASSSAPKPRAQDTPK
jgi:hypothetical protein